MNFRTSFSRVRVSAPACSDSLTVQSEAAACEIDSILAQHIRGLPVTGNALPPMWQDNTAVPDYLEAQNLVVSAQHSFEALPSAIRARFRNDPLEMLRFLSDAENRPEAIRLGLVEDKPPAVTAESPAASPAAAQ
ncbi:minor capsid protein [Capybara microvirus Cap1_SP_167]|nr:minor capsid protein [Capybara microvirus Cap1_SP_167]